MATGWTEPVDPAARWVGPGEQSPAVGAAVEGARAEDGENAAAPVGADHRGGDRQALDAVAPGGPERHQGIERQPGHRALAARLGQDAGQPGTALRFEEHGQICVDDDDPAGPRQVRQDTGQRVHGIPGHDRGRVAAGHGHRRGQPGQRGFLRRRARLQPGAGIRVAQVDRVRVDADPFGHRREAGGRRAAVAAHLAAQAHAGGRRPERCAAHLVAVALQVQPEPGSGAQVNQRDRLAARARRGRDAERDLGAAGHLVHLVPPAGADPGDVVRADGHEVLGRGEEAVVEPRLRRSRHREVTGQRLGAVAAHQERDRRTGQQRGQAVPRQAGQPLAQRVMRGDGLEQRGCQPPGRRGVRPGPARRDLERLGPDLAGPRRVHYCLP
jgi:hypothetical protein